jgi:WD40 repeat protein
MRMISVGSDRLLGLWDLAEFELVEGLPVEAGAAAAGFTNVPTEIVVAGGDASLVRRTLRFQRAYPRAAAAITGIAHRGDVFYASALDGTVRGFHVETGQATFQQNAGVPVRDVAVSADGQVLAGGGNDCTVRLWNAAGNAAHPKPVLAGFSAPVERVAFSVDGAHVLAASGVAREVFSFTVAQGTPATPEQQFADLPGPAVGLAGTVDSERPGVAAVAGKWLFTWDLAAGRQVAGHTAAVNVLETLPNDRDRFASGGVDGVLRIWQVSGDGRPTKQVACGDPIGAVAFTPDAARVAVAGGGVAARVFTVDNGQRVAEVRGDHAALAAISAADLRARAAVSTLAEQRRLSRERFTTLSREAEAAKAANEAFPAQVKKLGDALQALTGPVDEHLQAERELAALRSQRAGLEEEVARCALSATQAREPLAAAAASRAAREEALTLAKALLDRVTAAATAARVARVVDPADVALAAAEEEARQALTTATLEHRQAQGARQVAEQVLQRTKVRCEAAAHATVLAQKAVAEAATRIAAAEAKVLAKAGPVDTSRAAFDSARDAVATALAAMRGEAESRRKKVDRDKSVTDKAEADVQARARSAADAAVTDLAPLIKAASDAKGRNDAAALAAAALCEAVANAGSALDALAESQRTAAAAEGQVRRAAADVEIARREARRAERPIRSLAMTADGLVIATCGDDLAIRLWQAEGGTPLESLPGGGMPAAVAFAPAGRLLTAADTAVSWDIQPPWTLERTIGDPLSADLLVDRVAALAFGPDGKILATGGGEPSRSGELKIWNVADGALVRTVASAHADVVCSVAFSADGQFLLSGAADRFARIFDVGTGRLERSFEGHTHHVLGVAWRFDGRQIATCGADAAVKIWDPMTGDQMRTVSGAAKEVTAIAFLPGSSLVVAAGGDRKTRLIDATSGGVSRTFPDASAFLHAAAVSAAGKLVVAAGQDGVVHVWNTDNGQVVRTVGPLMAEGRPGIHVAPRP